MQRKIDKMRSMFGYKEGQKCKDCMHLRGGKNEYRKCKVYGVSNSKATDWNLSYDACGLWNEEYSGDTPIYKLNVTSKKETQVEGQISLF